MNARRIGNLIAATTLVATGSYVFVYLYRWEWNRAIVSGVLFLAAEVAVVGWRVTDRLRSLERRLAGADAQVETRVRRLRETAPPPKVTFEWLAPDPTRTNVFVPVLMGAGLVLSGIAWVVERLARATARPIAEQALAGRLGTVAAPTTGFLHRRDPLQSLRGPVDGCSR